MASERTCGIIFIQSNDGIGGSIVSEYHYENTPIQIYRKFHLQKPKIFR